jgi:rsbT co-antagonist protein RsbR
MKAASSLRLIGAKAVISGIRPELAQTLVTLDIDLSAVVTKGTLRSGIDYALAQAGNGASKR